MAQFSWRFLVWFSVLLLVMALCAVISVCMVVRVRAADHYVCIASGAGVTTYCHVPSLKG